MFLFRFFLLWILLHMVLELTVLHFTLQLHHIQINPPLLNEICCKSHLVSFSWQNHPYFYDWEISQKNWISGQKSIMHVAMCLVLRLTYVFCCHYKMSSFLHDRKNSSHFISAVFLLSQNPWKWNAFLEKGKIYTDLQSSFQIDYHVY